MTIGIEGLTMNLVLIRGGQYDGSAELQAAPLGAMHVNQEAARRLRHAGYSQAHIRSLATGSPVPRQLHYFKMQVDFVAKSLSALDAIPADFASDAYWPTF